MRKFHRINARPDFSEHIRSRANERHDLFIGIIVDAMQKEHEIEADASRAAVLSETEHILDEIKSLRAEVADLKLQLVKK